MPNPEFSDFFGHLKWQEPFGTGAPGVLAFFDAFATSRPQQGQAPVYVDGRWIFVQAGSTPATWSTAEW